MKKLFVLIFAIALTATSLFADNKDKNKEVKRVNTMSVNGSILDDQNQPVIGVKVLLKETNQYVYTDFEGNYSFKGVSAGDYNVEVSHVSFKDAVRAVSVEESTNLNISLESK